MAEATKGVFVLRSFRAADQSESAWHPRRLLTAYRLLDGLQWTLDKDSPAFDRAVAGSWGELDRIRNTVS